MEKLKGEDPETIRQMLGPVYRDAWLRSGGWGRVRWLGREVLKHPADLWWYQEVLFERRPDVLIEVGTYKGGSALWFASVMDLIGTGRVVTVDVESVQLEHPRIKQIVGDSLNDEVLEKVHSECEGRVLVSLDGNHERSHLRREIEAYSPLVTVGSFLVVEDTMKFGCVDTASRLINQVAEEKGWRLATDLYPEGLSAGGWLERV